MKNILILILMSALMASCKSNTQRGVKDSLIIAKTAYPSPELIKIFKPVLQGTWVKKAYIDKIAKTKSPLAAADEADLTTFVINTELIKGDSLKVLAGWGNHDCSELILKFKKGTRPMALIFGAGELSLSSINGGPILTYYHPDEKSKKTIATQ